MATARISIVVEGVADAQRLARRLRDAGQGGLHAALRRRFAAAGGPLVSFVRAAALGMRVTSTGTGGAARRHEALRTASPRLRPQIAAATHVSTIPSGVRITVDSGQLPAGKQMLPRLLNSPRGWRHEVFGHAGVRVFQRGEPFFDETISKKAPGAFRSAAESAVSDTIAEIEK